MVATGRSLLRGGDYYRMGISIARAIRVLDLFTRLRDLLSHSLFGRLRDLLSHSLSTRLIPIRGMGFRVTFA